MAWSGGRFWIRPKRLRNRVLCYIAAGAIIRGFDGFVAGHDSQESTSRSAGGITEDAELHREQQRAGERGQRGPRHAEAAQQLHLSGGCESGKPGLPLHIALVQSRRPRRRVTRRPTDANGAPRSATRGERIRAGPVAPPPSRARRGWGLTTATEAGSPSTEQAKRRDDEPGDAEHAPGQAGFRGADLGRQPRIEVRNLGAYLRDFGAHLGHADLELVGRDVIALLDDQPESVREGVRLGGREVGGGQRPVATACVSSIRSDSPMVPVWASCAGRSVSAEPPRQLDVEGVEGDVADHPRGARGSGTRPRTRAVRRATPRIQPARCAAPRRPRPTVGAGCGVGRRPGRS